MAGLPGAARSVEIAGSRFVVVDDKPSFWDKMVAGAWEPELLALLADRLRPGTVFIDIGAWVGPLTLLAAARGARVIAVEADPRALELLGANLAANPSLADQVSVVARALSPSSAPVRMASPRKPGDSMASTLLGNGAGAWQAASVTPEALALMAQGAEGDEMIVKIDIEGGEYDVLGALVAQLPARASLLIVAFHPRQLLAGGRMQAEVEQMTQACARALSGWSVKVLERYEGDGEAPFARAARINTTLALSRPAG